MLRVPRMLMDATGSTAKWGKFTLRVNMFCAPLAQWLERWSYVYMHIHREVHAQTLRNPRPYGLAPEASALDHSAKLSCTTLREGTSWCDSVSKGK